MSVRNTGRPLWPVMDRDLYATEWEWGTHAKETIEGFFSSSKLVYGPNLIFNGDAESGVQGWSLQTGTGTLRSSTESFAGSFSIKVDRTAESFPAPGASQAVRISSRFFRLGRGKLYATNLAMKLDATIQGAAGAGDLRLYFVFEEPSSSQLFISGTGVATGAVLLNFPSHPISDSSVWGLMTAIIAPPTDMWVWAQVANATAASLFFDDAEMREIIFQ